MVNSLIKFMLIYIMAFVILLITNFLLSFDLYAIIILSSLMTICTFGLLEENKYINSEKVSD